MSTIDLIIMLLVIGIIVITASIINLSRSKSHRRKKTHKSQDYY